jgi:hypothetical protein
MRKIVGGSLKLCFRAIPFLDERRTELLLSKNIVTRFLPDCKSRAILTKAAIFADLLQMVPSTKRDLTSSLLKK